MVLLIKPGGLVFMVRRCGRVALLLVLARRLRCGRIRARARCGTREDDNAVVLGASIDMHRTRIVSGFFGGAVAMLAERCALPREINCLRLVPNGSARTTAI